MKWKECVEFNEFYGINSRLEWPSNGGFDCDPTAATINDVLGAISWVYTYPGDWIISRPVVRSFFEIDPSTVVVGSGWSWVFPGAFIWFLYWFIEVRWGRS